MSPAEPRVGYVTKMFPRFSETFIVNEVLAHEAAGLDLEIFSLRPPADGRFHGSLAAVRAPVTYIPHADPKARAVWDALARAESALPGLAATLPELTSASVTDAAQALEVALLSVERGVDHLHAHFATVGTTVARLAGLLADIPYSFTAHAKDIFHESVDPGDLRTKLADAAAVVTVSDFNLDHLRSTFGSDAATVRRIYNGLDLDAFPYRSPADRPPVVVAVGRLVEKKGFQDLVTACAVLRDRGTRVACRIVGAGPEEAALRAQVSSLGLEGTVELLGPRVQHEVAELVQGAAAFAAPCVVGEDGNRDGMPTVLLEAMALGAPCVATPVTGIPELLDDERSGLLVDERSPVALAGAIERLVDDSDLRVALAEAARARIEADFDVHQQAALVRSCFDLVPAS